MLEAAAALPGVLHVRACVHAPALGLDGWCGSAGGPPPLAAFRIASVTKMFTAAAVLRLAEEGRLGLHDPLRRRLGDDTLQALAAGGYDVDALTLDHLLTHCAGLPDHTHHGADERGYVDAVLAAPQRRWTRGEQLALALSMGPPLGPPGELFQYSDTGYVLLGEVIERLTQAPLGLAVRQVLALRRRELPHTWWEGLGPAPAGAPPRAAQWLEGIDASPFDPSFDLFGGGGLVSTVADLARFTRALLRGEVFRHPGTLAAALMVPEARRAPGSRVHARMAHAFPVTPSDWGWGHLGFWGCGAISWPERDITVALSFDQWPLPDTLLLRRTVQQLVAAATGDEPTPSTA